MVEPDVNAHAEQGSLVRRVDARGARRDTPAEMLDGVVRSGARPGAVGSTRGAASGIVASRARASRVSAPARGVRSSVGARSGSRPRAYAHVACVT